MSTIDDIVKLIGVTGYFRRHDVHMTSLQCIIQHNSGLGDFSMCQSDHDSKGKWNTFMSRLDVPPSSVDIQWGLKEVVVIFAEAILILHFV